MPAQFLPYAYFEGAIVPLSHAKVSVATHALQYGTAVFGGIRGYLDQDGHTINIFRLPDHARRFSQSAALLKIQLPFDVDSLCSLAVDLTRRNAPTGNVYYRPFAYKAGLDLTPKLSGVADGFALYMLPLDEYYEVDQGLSVTVSAWQRVNDVAIPARGKVSGAYVNSALACDDARAQGFDDAILLNARGKVSEGSAANLFLVRHGALITPPLTADILEGITRRSILQLARDLGIPVEERDVDRTELYYADEIFFCGTGAQVTWVGQVDRRLIGDGQPGPITTRLKAAFLDAVRGKSPAYRHWLTPVAIPAEVASR